MDPLKHAQRTKSREYSLDGVGDFPPLAIEQAIQWLGEGSRGAATSKLQTCTCFSRVFVCSYTAYSSPVHSRSGSFSPSHGTTCSQRVLRNPDACSAFAPAHECLQKMVPLGFTGGNMDDEKAYVDGHYLRDFASSGWIITKGIHAIWSGKLRLKPTIEPVAIEYEREVPILGHPYNQPARPINPPPPPPSITTPHQPPPPSTTTLT